MVSDYNLNEEGDYGIALVIIPGAATSGTDSDGGEISSGETKTGTLTSEADTDIFQFNGTAGDRVIITTAELIGGVEPEIYLYPPESGELEASDEGIALDHRLDHQLLETGLYTIVVSDYNLNEEGEYGIALVKIPGTATSWTDGDGGLIFSGEAFPGTLTYEADTDIYQFYGMAGDSVTITTVGLNGGVEPEIYLYPPDSGELEVSDEGIALDHRLDQQLLESGLYTIVVSDYNLNEEGDYEIYFETDGASPIGIYNMDPPNGSVDVPREPILSWDAVSGATSYDVYFSSSPIEPMGIRCSGILSPSCSVGFLRNGTVYYWYVTAETSGGMVRSPYAWFKTVDTGFYSISGQVTLNGASLSGVEMTLSGASSGNTTTDASGNYSFDNLGNGLYWGEANMAGYSFTPTQRTITISGASVTGQDFTALNTQVAADRYLPFCASAGTNFDVTIDINVDEANAPSGLIVNENLPSAWILNSASPIYDTYNLGEIRWVFYGNNVMDRTISYNVSVPGTETDGAVRSFGGDLKYVDPYGNDVVVQINGDQDVTICPITCHPYDEDCNWCMGDFELLNAIDDWANEKLGDFELLDIIGIWASEDCFCFNSAQERYQPGADDGTGECLLMATYVIE